MPHDASELYLFEGLSRDEIVYFLMMSETRFYKAGDVIVTQGEPSNDEAYYVQSGSVEVLQDGKIISTLPAGQVFGEISLVMNEPRTATVHAAEQSEIMVMRKDEFLTLWKKSPYYPDLQQTLMARIRENHDRAQGKSSL